MITINNLAVSYRENKKVINSLSLTIPTAEIHGVVGLNGTGKTTLLNTIYGLKKSDTGEVCINGIKASKKTISYLETENFFYSNITGREYLSLFQNKLFDEEQWNELFSLPLDQVIDEYSTGMRKKLALFAVLKQNKPVMILDEPFNGIDIEACRIVRAVLLKLKEKGKTIIITSHIIETLTNLCDKISYLEKGKISYTKDKSNFAKFQQEIFDAIENNNAETISKLV